MAELATLLDLDAIEGRFREVVAGDAWRAAEDEFALAERVYLLGTGGNLAVAQHAAADIARLTAKRAVAPCDSVTATSLMNHAGSAGWLAEWLSWEVRADPAEQRPRTLVVGLSCSGDSPAVMAAMRLAHERGLRTVLLSGAEPAARAADVTVVLGTSYYHSSEALMLLLTYQLTVSVGGVCPRLPTPGPQT